MNDCDIAIIGAGPYGLAAAAYLRHIQGLGLRLFGEPMEFWRTRMPQGMLLRSAWSASSIADPHAALSIDAYKRVSGNHLAAPISLNRFVDYGLWFQRNAVPEVQRTPVTFVEQHPRGFHLTLRDGNTLTAARVIVAAGISSFAFRPTQFSGLPQSLISHTSDQSDFRRFAGKRVTVVGSGQSALESAALLHECGADVELLIRRPSIHWLGWKHRFQKLGPLSRAFFSPHDVGPAGVSWLVANPPILNKFPRPVQERLRRLCLRPAGARWLRDRTAKVRVTTGKRVVSAAATGESVLLTLSDGTTRVADHVLLGTGYRIDISRYDFLGPALLKAIQCLNGFPQLTGTFESSVPGLHFLGAPAAWNFGPLMYFVSGTRYAASTLGRSLQRQRSANT